MAKTKTNGKSRESWVRDAAYLIRGAKNAPMDKDCFRPLYFTKRLGPDRHRYLTCQLIFHKMQSDQDVAYFLL